jgi:hypothetical protein
MEKRKNYGPRKATFFLSQKLPSPIRKGHYYDTEEFSKLQAESEKSFFKKTV